MDGLMMTIILFFAAALVVFIAAKWAPGGDGRTRPFVGRPGSSYTCNSDGCGRAHTQDGGEFHSEGSCKRACISYVKQGDACVQVPGAPWDSYASENACREGR